MRVFLKPNKKKDNSIHKHIEDIIVVLPENEQHRHVEAPSMILQLSLNSFVWSFYRFLLVAFLDNLILMTGGSVGSSCWAARSFSRHTSLGMAYFCFIWLQARSVSSYDNFLRVLHQYNPHLFHNNRFRSYFFFWKL